MFTPVPKELACQKIAELVERFEEQYENYKNGEYNETLTRRDFIDPFFKALGTKFQVSGY
jgi:predicted type IV restriction endonuclease